MKTGSFHELTGDELSSKLGSLREELFNLRCQNALHQLENPMRIRQVRRDIARVQTEIAVRGKAQKRA